MNAIVSLGRENINNCLRNDAPVNYFLFERFQYPILTSPTHLTQPCKSTIFIHIENNIVI
jgi:hypothetical protein